MPGLILSETHKKGQRYPKEIQVIIGNGRRWRTNLPDGTPITIEGSENSILVHYPDHAVEVHPGSFYRTRNNLVATGTYGQLDVTFTQYRDLPGASELLNGLDFSTDE